MQDSDKKKYIEVLKNSEDLIKNFKEELKKNNIEYTDELLNSFCKETAEKEFKKVNQDLNKTVNFKEQRQGFIKEFVEEQKKETTEKINKIFAEIPNENNTLILKQQNEKNQGLIEDLLNNQNVSFGVVRNSQAEQNSGIKEKNKKSKKVSFVDTTEDKNKKKDNLAEIIKVESFKEYNVLRENLNTDNNEECSDNIEVEENKENKVSNEEKFFYNQSWSERSTGSKAGFILSIFPGLGLPFLFNLIYHKCSCNCCATIDKSSINAIEEDKKI